MKLWKHTFLWFCFLYLVILGLILSGSNVKIGTQHNCLNMYIYEFAGISVLYAHHFNTESVNKPFVFVLSLTVQQILIATFWFLY